MGKSSVIYFVRINEEPQRTVVKSKRIIAIRLLDEYWSEKVSFSIELSFYE